MTDPAEEDRNGARQSVTLVSDSVLANSPVVANCRMNRERHLSGSNGYGRELKFEPLEFLRSVVLRRGAARWLDLCCGTATALVEAAVLADQQQLSLRMVGVDLAGFFKVPESGQIALHQADLAIWETSETFDLITCVHGLHYIGDKLGLIVRARRWLNPEGCFVAHLDLSNIRLHCGTAANRIMLRAFRHAGFEYLPRQKLVRCTGPDQAALPFDYLGADDQAGPNSTGQPAVNSWYEIRDSRS